MKTESHNNHFKSCTACRSEWKNRNEFLSDPDISVIGYQVHFKELEHGLFLFNHRRCKSTLSIRVNAFTDLYQGPVYKDRKTEGESCPGYCLYQSELRSCPAECECAYVREILQIIREWQKVQIP
jgi:hypothetical protein